MKTCTKCFARLPLRFFPLVNSKRQAACSCCLNTARRLREPLALARPDPLQIRLNNAACTWFGPREPSPSWSIR